MRFCLPTCLPQPPQPGLPTAVNLSFVHPFDLEANKLAKLQ